MTTVLKSPQYERDLADIWTHIADNSEEAADRVIAAIEETIELIVEFPGLGAPCPHLVSGLRRTMWREYLIYYRVREDTIEIVRALHGRRNIVPEHFD
jgi:toxin ParE1/3/4